MSKVKDSQILGTPVAEGVRFEIGDATAYAVRDERRQVCVRVRRQDHTLRNLLLKLPLIRGVVRLLSCICGFFSGLNRAQELQPRRTVKGSPFMQRFAGLFSTHPQTLFAICSGLLIPVLLVGLMIGLPAGVEWLLGFIPGGVPRFAVNAVCCAFRVAGALLAVFCICRLRLPARLCMYRGAIAKVRNAYAAYGSDLTPEEVVLSSRLTDRSDGAFCLAVLSLSLIVFSWVRIDEMAMQLLFRAGTILVVAAIANELILPLERAKPDTIRAALRRPLIGLQQLFTIEPHGQMIETALAAFRAAWENNMK